MPVITGKEPPLRELVAKGRSAVVVMELQRGVVGDLACIPELAKAVAEAGVIERTTRLLRAARAAGVRVIHCTAAFRRDRAGSPGNVPLVNRLLENPDHLLVGSPAVEVVPGCTRASGSPTRGRAACSRRPTRACESPWANAHPKGREAAPRGRASWRPVTRRRTAKAIAAW